MLRSLLTMRIMVTVKMLLTRLTNIFQFTLIIRVNGNINRAYIEC